MNVNCLKISAFVTCISIAAILTITSCSSHSGFSVNTGSQEDTSSKDKPQISRFNNGVIYYKDNLGNPSPVNFGMTSPSEVSSNVKFEPSEPNFGN